MPSKASSILEEIGSRRGNGYEKNSNRFIRSPLYVEPEWVGGKYK